MSAKSDSFVPDAELIREAFAGSSGDDVTFLLRQCLDVGAWDHALAICEALGPSAAPGVRLCEAIARFVGGDAAGAGALVDGVLAENPDHLSAQWVRAQLLARSGDRDAARRQLLSLVLRYPDFPGAHGMLATLFMPGPHYREVLAKLHERLRPRCYFEIGVDTGVTLALARASERVVGVDPADTQLVQGVPRHASVFREESNTFFARRTRESVLGERRVDLAFVDGLHLFENALMDFANVERWAHPGATIVLHDCVPLIAQTATRVRKTKFWVGDTWKVVSALSRYRPDLKIRTILTPPSGLVVVRRLNPGSTLLLDRFQQIVTDCLSLEWRHPPGEFPPTHRVVMNDEPGFQKALA